MAANGWEVIQIRHGSLRQSLFKKTGGDLFKKFIEEDLVDYELQALLLVQDEKFLKKEIIKDYPGLKKFLDQVSDKELFDALRDFGGHDIIQMAEALLKSKESKRKPTIIIAHTLKGWGLKMAAQQGNHSSLSTQEEMDELRAKQGITQEGVLFQGFDPKSAEGKYLTERGEKIYSEIKAQNDLKNKNQKIFAEKFSAIGSFPESLEINTKMTSYPHTQWMLGQLTAKLTRIANTADVSKLPANEQKWRDAAELFMTMAPDVGTSTNLNPAMDGKIFGACIVDDFETEMGVKDTKLPNLIPDEDQSHRFLRFEIAEGNVMSCVGSFGKVKEILGIPTIPLMTVYDFFIKRAMDQYFYNLYWKSNFICVGTPSGVTLSPEGAQHGWKSDFQIPNQVTWEPYFCLELDWILCDAFRRHMLNDNTGRQGVLLRLVTRGAEQKNFMKYVTKQLRFKSDVNAKLTRAEFPVAGGVNEEEITSINETEILSLIRKEVLQGAYYLIDYRGYAGYEPGDNVVNIFSMGSLTGEAIKASEDLLSRGIYANVIVVTSPDLLCGIQAHENDYDYLRNQLGINSDLYLNRQGDVGSADLVMASGRRIPIVSVHDGEAGILDNIGSVVGVRQESCAVRKHSKCGRPSEIYHFHEIDAEAIIDSCGKVLSETALEKVIVSQSTFNQVTESADQSAGQKQHWTELWPTKNQSHKH
jgi:pyruvate dehydrogenase E1 component